MTYTITPSIGGWTYTPQNVDETGDPVLVDFLASPIPGEVQGLVRPGDYVINDAGDVDALAEYTEIDGDLTIQDYQLSQLTDSSETLNLKVVNGSLTVQNTNLTNLHGLESVTDIAYGLHIYNNIELISLNGLNGLTTINYKDYDPWTGAPNLTVLGNPNLTNIAALANLSTIIPQLQLRIQDNQSLNSIYGLNHIETLASLQIENNPLLINLHGLENLRSTTLWCKIANNESLTSISSIGNLTSVGTELTITENNSLTTLAGLNNLVTASSVGIANNNNLTAISMDSLTIGSSINITNNSSLTSLHLNIESVYRLEISYNNSLTSLDLDALRHVSGYMNISYNPCLCLSLISNLIGHGITIQDPFGFIMPLSFSPSDYPGNKDC
ncbi:MAG: hypothetical protein C0403_00335 [Desulfobacterium sp.]|nr:hypothetical protein [Desulfobacterium sp.]